jgi:mercuric ion transport protein
MISDPVHKYRKRFFVSLIGTIAVAGCCFTPIIVIAAGAVGLGTIVPYLDVVLLPALGLLLIVTIVFYVKWRKTE